jgi:double zinc ribbon protein
MQCPQCQHENPPESNFCLGCGNRLGLQCASCGSELSAGSRYSERISRTSRTAGAVFSWRRAMRPRSAPRSRG